jgi:small subunit ribosomal protein S20
MPITTSAKKALRQSLRKRAQNKIKSEQMKKAIKSIKKLIDVGKKSEAAKLVSSAYKAIDKAAKTGVIKKNTAGRKKAVLMRMVHKNTKS